jgi:hypothetical protein
MKTLKIKFKKLNNKLKEATSHFFYHTRFGKAFMKSMAWLNTAEGIIHLVVAVVGAWGLIDTSTFDVRAWTPVFENFVFGIFSVLVGWALGIGHDHHHHHHHNHKEEE